MKSEQVIWQQMLSSLEIEATAISFDVWIKPLNPLGIVDSKLILAAPGEGGKEFVNSRFRPLLKSVLLKVEPALKDIIIVAPEETDFYKVAAEPEKKTISEPAVVSDLLNIKPKYNFENFVVGKCNQFVYAAARAVAEEPGVRYNPLFIYGGVGLGKTHLLHAIGNAIRENEDYGSKKILYVSSETFVNEFIDSIRTGKNSNNMTFREKYRNVDVLMIDDVQFISKKPGTQEEMFHTFNDLYQENKQLIFTSDRPPKEIPDLEERVRSRFEWGLIADIGLPDLETRIAILQKKAQSENYNLSMDVLTLMAERIENNVREMESLLNKVLLLSKLQECTPSVDIVKEALKDYAEKNEDTITADDIIECVCQYFKVGREELVGKKKHKEIVEPRQICIYIINEMLALPLTGIGNIFGGREHTTIMHARDKVSSALVSNPKMRTVLQDIKAMILRK